jgi:hypothetical protein
MAELKTQPSKKSPVEYLKTVENQKKQADSFAILELMSDITGVEPVMWGDSIIGFGTYHYKYASGREGEWFLTGFAPRKQSLTLYIMSGFSEYKLLLSKLGKYKTGKSCLYINKLEDIDIEVLRDLVERSVEHMEETNA